jgi:hypothetical protein
MAQPRTEDHHEAKNPDVRFERSDVEVGSIVFWGACFTGLTVFAILFIMYVAPIALRSGRPKESDLPPAVTDSHRLPPPPILEGIEDLIDWRNDRSDRQLPRPGARPPELLPPRAEWERRPQEEALAKGGKEAVPIEQAMEALSKKGALPAAKRNAPTNFGVRLPSKAASGWRSTGGDDATGGER